MYIELINVDDRMARSFVCTTEEVNNGGFVKVKGLASLSKGGVNLTGEAYEVIKCDATAGLFGFYAPDNHRYDERILSGDVPAVKANALSRGYILAKGDVVRVEVGNVNGVVAVGDLLEPKANTFQLTKASATPTNVVGQVLKLEKYHGKDTAVILFV